MASILIVDDDEIQRRLAGHLLRGLKDLEISYAEDGAKAIESIARATPDLVLTDLNMPGMSGLQLVEQLHLDRPTLPIILMTASGSEQVAVAALHAGASSYVPKSDLRQTLPDTVRKLLQVVQSHRQRSQLLKYLKHGETYFVLDNDPDLVPPLLGYLQDNIDRLGFADPSLRMDVGMAMMEALSNAMYHGNLEVSSDLRQDGQEAYDAKIQERRGEDPYRSRKVHLTARESREGVTYIIRDEGPGFDWRKLPDPTLPENMEKLCGRGLLMMRTFMDSVEYNDAGNQVTLTKRIKPQ